MNGTDDHDPSRPDCLSPPLPGAEEIAQEEPTATIEPVVVSARSVVWKTGPFSRRHHPRTPSHRPVRTVANGCEPPFDP